MTILSHHWLRLPLALVLALALALGTINAFGHGFVGANLNGIADFTRNHEFVDVVKQSRKFLVIGQFDDTVSANLAPLGSDGWPSTDFRLFAMAAQQDTLGLAGTYKIVFNGRATLSTSGGGAGSIANQTYDAASNTTRADLIYPAGAENFMLDFTATNGQVKNLRVIRPGFDAANPPTFTTTYLDHVRRFSVLRFMDWMRTNEAQGIVSWADRTTSDKLKTEAHIARWETVIDLANTVNRDIWINIPVNANDEYVTSLSTLLRDSLSTSVNVYVEYSNEVWNGSFPQFQINFNAAVAEVAANAASPLRFDGSTDQNTWANRRVALRLKQIGDIFRTVWGGAAINTRIRPVLAGQMATSFRVSEGLRVIDEGLNIRPDTVFYAIAGAPYLFASAIPDADADEVAGLSVDQILAGISAGVTNAPSETDAYQYLTHAGLGAWYGLKVLAYEGGFDNFGSANIGNKRAANLDPRIRTICTNYLNQWHSYGFEHFLWFNAGAASYDTRFGMWPLLEDMSNPAAPKNQCIDDVLAAGLPSVTLGNAVLGAAIPGGAFRDTTSANGSLSGLASPFGFPGYVEYLLRADTEGSYSLVFRGSAPASESFRVKLNNATAAANVSLPASTGDAQAVTLSLRRGLNAMRIERAVGASWQIDSMTFALASVAGSSFSAASSGSNRNLTVTASVQASSADSGRSGLLFAVASVPGAGLFCLTSTGWTPCGSTFPSLASVTLRSHTIPLLDGSIDVSGLAGTDIYVGYGLSLADMLNGIKYQLVYRIQ